MLSPPTGTVTFLFTDMEGKVLATSRIALHLYGEHEYAVPPLAVPDPAHLPEPEAVSQYEAVRLFIEHARADFAIWAFSRTPWRECCANRT